MIPRIFDYLPQEVTEGLLKSAGVAVESGQPETEGRKEGPFGIGLKGVLAYGAGVGVGGLGGYYLDKAYTKATGKDIHARHLLPVASAVSLGGKYLYDRWKTEELKRMQDAYKAKRNDPKSGSSGQQL